MQTFLPLPSFTDSARTLDNRRLGKQLVEVQQITKALDDPDYGWQNHPAVNMWRYNRGALLLYGRACYWEWKRRFRDGERGGKLRHKSGEFILAELAELVKDGCVFPPLPLWLGGQIHASHRAALLLKDPEHYGRFGWTEEPARQMYWPV
jgi:hypothetical protein